MENKNNKTTTKKNTINNVSSTKKNVDLENKIKMLEKKLEERDTLLEEMKNFIASQGNKTVQKSELNPNRLITVVSLIPNKLVLNNKNGREWVFNHIGAKQKIPALDLAEIYSSHETFATKGYYYICDKDFIEENGLEDIYSTLLSYEEINNILEKPNKEMQAMLENCSDTQFQSVFGILISRLLNIPSDEYDENKNRIFEKVYNKKFPSVEKFKLDECIEDIKYLTVKK